MDQSETLEYGAEYNTLMEQVDVWAKENKQPILDAEPRARLFEDYKILKSETQAALCSVPPNEIPKAKPLTNMWALLVGIEEYPQVDQQVDADRAEILFCHNDGKTPLDNWGSQNEQAVEPNTPLQGGSCEHSDDVAQDKTMSNPNDPDLDEVLGNPDGALHDVHSVYDYFVRERGVPATQILVLMNEEATRENILDAFQTHLINNPDIVRDDPILFHFSGHGCQGPAPSAWANGLDEENAKVEYIVPYDSIVYGQKGLGKPGIPDRTTRALIHKLAARKGRNVSIVLDCCHSGHGVRKGETAGPNIWRARGVKVEHIGKLEPDTDHELWDCAETRHITGVGASTSFTDGRRDDDTHVLLAACTRLELAIGSAGFGGMFTNAWLAILREGRARTYAEALALIKGKLAAIYEAHDTFHNKHPRIFPSHARLDKQSPQCEGFNRDRNLFASSSSAGREFEVSSGDKASECVINDAGDLLGVKEGTMFELRLPGEGPEFTILGSAVAQEVHKSACIAKLPQGLLLPANHVRAVISKLSDPVNFDTRNLHPDSSKAIQAFELLNSKLAAKSPYYKRVTGEKADLVLEVDEECVHFNRQDIRLSTIDTPSPKLPVDDIDRIADVMKGVAHFNYYLSFESDAHPFATQVDVHLHELERVNAYNVDALSCADPCRYMRAGEPVRFENGEALIVHEHDEQLYALVLRSSASQPLFVYVLLFDPATYGVEVFAQPLNAEDPALKPDQTVQFGRSSECEDALWFDVGEDNKKDTGYLKIILATEGDLNLTFMEQGPVLGDDVAPKHERAMHGNTPQPMKGVWDVITRKLTVLPEKIN